MSGLRIALDGPGSSGKSSVGAAAATQLGYRFLDTGVLYRAITWLSVQRDIDPTDQESLVALVPELELVPDEEGRMRRVKVGGVDVTDQLHAPEVDRRVSDVSRQPRVRAALLQTQREPRRGRSHHPGRSGHRHRRAARCRAQAVPRRQRRGTRPAARRRAATWRLTRARRRASSRTCDARDHIDSSRGRGAPAHPGRCGHRRGSEGREFEDTVAEVVRIIRSTGSGRASRDRG